MKKLLLPVLVVLAVGCISPWVLYQAKGLIVLLLILFVFFKLL